LLRGAFTLGFAWWILCPRWVSYFYFWIITEPQICDFRPCGWCCHPRYPSAWQIPAARRWWNRYKRQPLLFCALLGTCRCRTNRQYWDGKDICRYGKWNRVTWKENCWRARVYTRLPMWPRGLL